MSASLYQVTPYTPPQLVHDHLQAETALGLRDQCGCSGQQNGQGMARVANFPSLHHIPLCCCLPPPPPPRRILFWRVAMVVGMGVTVGVPHCQVVPSFIVFLFGQTVAWGQVSQHCPKHSTCHLCRHLLLAMPPPPATVVQVMNEREGAKGREATSWLLLLLLHFQQGGGRQCA